MSTKISRGARLHLLRTVERLQFPMFTVRIGKANLKPDTWRTLFDKFGMARFSLPSGYDYKVLEPVQRFPLTRA